MTLAESISTWSKDPRKKCGCVIVDPFGRRILSTGYNGFPRGVEDSPTRMTDSETKSKYVVHAEANAIFNATLNGVSLKGAHLFIYGLPACNECAKAIIQVGITRVFNLKQRPSGDPARDALWKASAEISREMFMEVGIGLTEL